ncbi:hypothetical protein FRB99_002678 [Tulasnella sp. 403]|nr:hypothetical protein FRB99_002678 [Tulasnella sp. 403]
MEGHPGSTFRFAFSKAPSFKENEQNRKDSTPQPGPKPFARTAGFFKTSSQNSSSENSQRPTSTTPPSAMSQVSAIPPPQEQTSPFPEGPSGLFAAHATPSRIQRLSPAKMSPPNGNPSSPSTSASQATISRRLSGPPATGSALQQRLLMRKQQSMGITNTMNNISSPVKASNSTQHRRSLPHSMSAVARPDHPQIVVYPNTRITTPTTSLLHSIPDASQTREQIFISPIRERSTSQAPSDNRDKKSMHLVIETIQEAQEEKERLKTEVGQLKTTIAALDSDKAQLAAEKRSLAAKSNQLLNDAQARLEVMKQELDRLKDQGASMASNLQELVESKLGVAELRSVVTSSLAADLRAKDIKPLIEDSGDILGRATITRQTIDEIRRDTQSLMTNSTNSTITFIPVQNDRLTSLFRVVEQHVIDLLREQLQMCFGELSEAHNRVADLESEHSRVVDALAKSADDVSVASTRITVLAAELKEQQQANISALTKAGELEEAYVLATEQLRNQESALTELRENAEEMKVKLAVSQETEKFLRAECQRIPTLEAQGKEILSLQAEVITKEGEIGELRARVAALANVETTMSQANDVITQYRSDLEATKIAASALKTQASRLQIIEPQLASSREEVAVLRSKVERVEMLEHEVADLKKQLDSEKMAVNQMSRDVERAEKTLRTVEQDQTALVEKLQRSNTRCEVLEQRRADQEDAYRTQLEYTKEHLKVAETKLASAQEETRTLALRVSELSSTHTEAKLTIERRDEEVKALREQLQNQVQNNGENRTVIADLQRRWQSESTRSNDLHAKLESVTNHLSQAKLDLVEKLKQFDAERSTMEVTVGALRSEMEACKTKTRELEMELQKPVDNTELEGLRAKHDALAAKLRHAEQSLRNSEDSLKTIVQRFRAKEKLPELEASVIRDMIQFSREIYEKELVLKGNEIRQTRTQEAAPPPPAAKPADPIVSSSISEPPEPDGDPATTDNSPPSPTLLPARRANVAQHTSHVAISNRSGASSRIVPGNTRVSFADLNLLGSSGDSIVDVDEVLDNEDTVLKETNGNKTSNVAKKRTKRQFDDMEYDDIEDEENEEPTRGAPKTHKQPNLTLPTILIAEGKPGRVCPNKAHFTLDILEGSTEEAQMNHDGDPLPDVFLQQLRVGCERQAARRIGPN